MQYPRRPDIITGNLQYTPEVTWNVIRTLTENRPTAWTPATSDSQSNDAPGGNTGEPVMSGRIDFVRKRTASTLCDR